MPQLPLKDPAPLADSRTVTLADLPTINTVVAMDFETANESADSACALGLVRIENGEIVSKQVRLIRPPSQTFLFTDLHGISWRQVADKPLFADVWREFEKLGLLEGAEVFAAHNAAFDRGVLAACLRASAMPWVTVRWADTVRIARDAWNIFPTRLPDVCRRLAIRLSHHDALSDASACAEIVVRARKLAAAQGPGR